MALHDGLYADYEGRWVRGGSELARTGVLADVCGGYGQPVVDYGENDVLNGFSGALWPVVGRCVL